MRNLVLSGNTRAILLTNVIMAGADVEKIGN